MKRRRRCKPAMQLPKPVRPRQLISLTPLIDVVFILLVFFMLASSFHTMRAVEIDTPAGSATTASVEGAVLIRLMANGMLDLNGIAIESARLVDRVESRLALNPGQRFVVQAEPGVPFQRVVTMFDRLAEAGTANVGLARGRGQTP